MAVKKPKMGFEVEFFLLDSEGNAINRADHLMKQLGRKKRLEKLMTTEISRTMIEFGAIPKVTVKGAATCFLESLREIIEIAEKEDIYLAPSGTYPAKAEPKLRKKPWYAVQGYIVGHENLTYVGKVCGFHFHYTLPRGIVKTEKIKKIKHSKSLDVFINQYNLLVCSDPVCMTFAQSSPFLDGKYIGKDTRALLYRDLTYEEKDFRGLYAEHPVFGSLPPYEFTLEDIKNGATYRKNVYLTILRIHGVNISEIIGYPELKFSWGPLRVNKIGTFEYRGMDMNHPMYNLSTGALLKYAMDAIKDNNLQARPSDIGTDEPFKMEDDVVYLPPFSRVRSLQYLSSVYGLENSGVYEYCRRFFDFVCKASDKTNSKTISKIKEMLKKKKTVSDEMLDLVKKNGHSPEEVPEEFLKYVALYHAKKLSDEIDKSIELYSSGSK